VTEETTPEPQDGEGPEYGSWTFQSPEHLRWSCERLVDQLRSLWEQGVALEKRAFLATATQ
jgi:hypothetical protein